MRTRTISGPMEKKETLFQFTTKVIDNQLKVIDQFPCSEFGAKYFSVSFLMACLYTSKKTTFFVCMNQVLSIEIRVFNNLYTSLITHEIYKVFDGNFSLDVQGVSLDISKTFDNFWNEGLLCSIKRNGTSGDLLKLIESFLSDKYQRVVLNGQNSKQNKLRLRFLKGQLFFPIYRT